MIECCVTLVWLCWCGPAGYWRLSRAVAGREEESWPAQHCCSCATAVALTCLTLQYLLAMFLRRINFANMFYIYAWTKLSSSGPGYGQVNSKSISSQVRYPVLDLLHTLLLFSKSFSKLNSDFFSYERDSG